MSDLATKTRVSRRLQSSRLHKGTDCPHALKGKGHALDDVTPPRQTRRSATLRHADVDAVLAAPATPEPGYVKPNNNSGYYGFYMEDGQLLRTFHCSDAFEYPVIERENIADQLDFSVDNFDEDDEPVSLVGLYDGLIEGINRKVHVHHAVYDGEAFEDIVAFAPGLKPRKLWYGLTRVRYEEPTKPRTLAAVRQEASDSENFFHTADADVVRIAY